MSNKGTHSDQLRKQKGYFRSIKRRFFSLTIISLCTHFRGFSEAYYGIILQPIH